MKWRSALKEYMRRCPELVLATYSPRDKTRYRMFFKKGDGRTQDYFSDRDIITTTSARDMVHWICGYMDCKDYANLVTPFDHLKEK